jgi:hypothetical protein
MRNKAKKSQPDARKLTVLDPASLERVMGGSSSFTFGATARTEAITNPAPASQIDQGWIPAQSAASLQFGRPSNDGK